LGPLLLRHSVYRHNPEVSPDGLAGQEGTFFPPAFTHLALISVAVNLDRQLG
jgi:hypothetical protein